MNDPTPEPDRLPPEPPPVAPTPDALPVPDDEDIPAVLPAPPRRPTHLGFWISLGVGGLLTVAGVVVGGEAQVFALTGLEVVPFVGLALVTYAGRSSDIGRILTVLYWAGLACLTAVGAFGMATIAELAPEALTEPRAPGRSPANLFLPGGRHGWGCASWGCYRGLLWEPWGSCQRFGGGRPGSCRSTPAPSFTPPPWPRSSAPPG
jgi:hypothetical protein